MRLEPGRGNRAMSSNSGSARYSARHRRSVIWMSLSTAAAALGLIGLFMILVVLLWKGVGGLSVAVFTEKAPARQRRRFRMRSSEA